MRAFFLSLVLLIPLTALPMTGFAAYGDYTHCGEGCSGMNPEYHECVNCCLETFQKVLGDCYAKCNPYITVGKCVQADATNSTEAVESPVSRHDIVNILSYLLMVK